jgi:hypothetical protein
VQILVIADDTKGLLASFLPLFGLIRSFSQNRLMMMPKHTLDPFVHVFELVMGHYMPITSSKYA